MRRVWAVGLSLVLVIACGDDDDSTTQSAVAGLPANPEGDPSVSETTGDWCDTFERLSTGPAPAAADVRAAADTAPEAIHEPMSTLASNDVSVSAAELFEATADVEAWAHQNCGTAHPFCGGWVQYKGLLGSIALSGAPEDEQGRAYEEATDILEVVRRYAPAELASDLDTITSTSFVSDEQERTAEAAFDDLDTWVDGNC